MTPQILAALLAALVLGVALLFLGLRGRRTDRTPLCRDCGFDLTGVLPDGKTCPECGSGLNRPKALRIGHRRRLWAVAATGFVLAAAPLSAFALAAYAALTGGNVAAQMPLGLLLAQARHGNAEAVADAAAELLARLNAGDLSDRQQSAAIDAILDIQGDPAAPWDESLGDFIEAARIAGGIDDDTYQRFLNQAIVVRFATRPVIAVGDPVPVSVSKVQDRVGTGSTVQSHISIRELRANGETLEWQRNIQAGSTATSQVTWNTGYVFTAWGSAAGMSGGTHTQNFSRLPKPPLSPGPHTLEIDYTVEGQLYVMGRSRAYGVDPSRQASASARLDFRVVPPDERDLTLLPASEEMTLRLIREIGVQIRTHESGTTGREGTMMVSFDLTHLPVPLAHDVFILVDGEELPIGTVQQLPADQLQPAASKRWGMQAGLGPGFLPPDAGPVGIVLKPNVELALDRADMRGLYNGEIIFRSVPIERR